MSIQALNWAYQQDVEPAARKFVLVTLANYASEDGHCYPSQETLAKMTGQSERTVREHLKALEHDGLIRRDGRRRKDGKRTSDEFFLAWSNDNRKISPVDAENNRQNSTGSPATSSGDQPARSAGKPKEFNTPSDNQQKGAPRPAPAEGADAARPEAEKPVPEPPENAEARAHWSACQQAIKQALADASDDLLNGAKPELLYRVWIEPLVCLRGTRQQLDLDCKDRAHLTQMLRRFKPLLDETTSRACCFGIEGVAKRIDENRKQSSAGS